ncbi:hypothetical protein [Thermodesulfitimonas sp.]
MKDLKSLLPLRHELAVVRTTVDETISKSGSRLSPRFLEKEALEDHLRPARVFLSGRLCGAPPAALFPLAATVQFIFLAGVLHRKASAADAKDDTLKNLILLGDYLYSASFRFLADAALQHLLIPLAQVVQAECAVVAAAAPESLELSIIEKEVALLIGECCRLPGTLADAPFTEELHDFGLNLGMLYGLLRRGASLSLATPYLAGAQAALARLPARPARHHLEKLLNFIARAILGVEAAATR